MGRIEGDLTVMPLADLVIWLANRRAHGQLTVESRTNHSVFHIEDGMITRAAANNPRQYFGQFLIHFGLLTEDQLQRAFDTQSETKVLLGRILVMIGIVPEEQVIQTLRIKFVENMLGAFRWKDGVFHFEQATRSEDRPRIEVAVPLVDVHAEGLSRDAALDEFDRLIPGRSSVLTVDESRLTHSAALDPIDTKIIELARHNLDLEAITLELHATDYQVAVRMAGLVKLGILLPREPSVQIDLDEMMNDHPDKHIELARQAMANREFANAFRHVEAGSMLDPENRLFSEIRREIDSRSDEVGDHQPSRDAIPSLARALEPGETRRMSAKQRYLLARIDGRRSVQSIIQVSPMHDFEALDILRQLATDGVIQL